MASIQDVADQINARLDQINTHTDDTATHTANILSVSQDMHSELVQANAQLFQIDAALDAGFANLSQGLFALLQVQQVALELLDHNRKQNDTIICELRNGNHLLCDIMRKVGRQVELGEAQLKAVERIEGIVERVHCCPAADYDREQEMFEQMKKCCPPQPETPESCPEDCKAPTYKERRPDGQDWKPLPKPQQPDPVG